MSTIPIDDKLMIGPDRANIDGRYKASNNRPYTSVAAAEVAINLVIGNVGLTVLVADENDPDYPEAKEYWVQPYDNNGVTAYHLVEKGAGTTDYAELDNKPTISDGGQGSAQIPLSGNVKVTATAATSGQTTGVAVTAENGGITMAFTLEKGADGVTPTIDPTTRHWMIGGVDTGILAQGADGQDGVTPTIDSVSKHWKIGETDTGILAEGHNPNRGTYNLSEITNAPTGIDGDYIVVVDASGQTPTAEIYKWDSTLNSNAGGWDATGITPNDAQFDGGQLVINTKIDNTQLANPASNALAKAEDIMPLAAKLEGVTATETKVLIYESGNGQNVFTGQYIKGDTGEIATPSSNVQSNAYCSIPLNDAKAVRFLTGTLPSASYSSGYAFGYFDENNDNAWVPLSASKFDMGSGVVEKVISVPDGATHLLTTVKNYNGTITPNAFYCYLQSGTSVKESIDNLSVGLYGKDELEWSQNVIPNGNYLALITYGTDVNKVVYQKVTTYGMAKRISLNDSILKIRIKGGYYNAYYMLMKAMPSTASKQTYTLQELVDGGYLSEAHYNSSTNTWKAAISISSYGEIEIDKPQDAKYLLCAIKIIGDNNTRTPDSVSLQSTKHIDGDFDKFKEEVNESINASNNTLTESVKLTYGAIDNAGEKVQSTSSVITNPIHLSKGICLIVKEQYRIYNSWLIDHVTGEIVDKYFLHYSSVSSVSNEVYRRFSRMAGLPEFDVVLSIVRVDGQEIESFDNIIDEYCNVDTDYKRIIPDFVSASIYKSFKEKLQTSLGFVWQPLAKVTTASSSDFKFLAGHKYFGVNYTGPTQWQKHVGMQISMRTFVTALANKRSVMYTEKVGGSGATSKYGYAHNSYDKESGAYYGCVCTGLTSYMLGLNCVVVSSEWHRIKTPSIGESHYTTWGNRTFNPVMGGDKLSIANPPTIWVYDASKEGDAKYAGAYSYDSLNDVNSLASLLRPMDFIWKDGHCAVISDIYVDDYGDVKYIVISEETGPVSLSQAYTPEFFFKRFKSNVINGDPWAVLRRKSEWSLDDVSIKRTGMDKDYCIMKKQQYSPRKIESIDADISTFAGEYVNFVIGDYTSNYNDFKAFLNIHRGGVSGYTHIQIFNEADDETVDSPIAEMTLDDSSVYIVKESDILGNSVTTPYRVLADDEEDDWIVYNLAHYWNSSQQNTVGKFKARVVRKSDDTITQVSGTTHFAMVKITFSNGEFSVKGGIPTVITKEQENGLMFGSKYTDIDLTTIVHDEITGEYSGILPIYTGNVRLFVLTDYGMASMRVNIES